jgi:hypothetical protein
MESNFMPNNEFPSDEAYDNESYDVIPDEVPRRDAPGGESDDYEDFTDFDLL